MLYVAALLFGAVLGVGGYLIARDPAKMASDAKFVSSKIGIDSKMN